MNVKQSRVGASLYVLSLVCAALGGVLAGVVVDVWTTFQKRLYAGLAAPSSTSRLRRQTSTSAWEYSTVKGSTTGQKSERLREWLGKQ